MPPWGGIFYFGIMCVIRRVKSLCVIAVGMVQNNKRFLS